jgi:hypothetical protein
LRGAQEVAEKHEGWKAGYGDITGPEGTPDGINEVYVTDNAGKLKMINGYQITRGKHAKRELWADHAPLITKLDKNNVENTKRDPIRNYIDNATLPAKTKENGINGSFEFPPPNKLGESLRKKMMTTLPGMRKIFIKRLLKFIWESWKKKSAIYPKMTTQMKLELHRIWSNYLWQHILADDNIKTLSQYNAVKENQDFINHMFGVIQQLSVNAEALQEFENTLEALIRDPDNQQWEIYKLRDYLTHYREKAPKEKKPLALVTDHGRLA